MGEHPSISLAIPVYNEEAVVPELIRRTTAVLDGVPGGPHEIVLVDDGSSDRTLEVLDAAAEKPGGSVLVTTSSIALIRRRTSGSRAATQPIDASGVGASQR